MRPGRCVRPCLSVWVVRVQAALERSGSWGVRGRVRAEAASHAPLLGAKGTAADGLLPSFMGPPRPVGL